MSSCVLRRITDYRFTATAFERIWCCHIIPAIFLLPSSIELYKSLPVSVSSCSDLDHGIILFFSALDRQFSKDTILAGTWHSFHHLFFFFFGPWEPPTKENLQNNRQTNTLIHVPAYRVVSTTTFRHAYGFPRLFSSPF